MAKKSLNNDRLFDNFLKYFGEVSNSCNILIDHGKLLEDENNISETIRIFLKFCDIEKVRESAARQWVLASSALNLLDDSYRIFKIQLNVMKPIIGNQLLQTATTELQLLSP